LRRDPAASKRLLIRAGSARSYYIGVDEEPAAPERVAPRRALCVIPRGTEEGTRFDLDRALTVISNQPAAFTLYSSADRTDPVNTLVAPGDAGDQPGPQGLQKHAPLVTAFRYGKRSRRVPLAVRLSAAFTETGTLEIWCRSEETDPRWRLTFNLRWVEADPLDGLGEETTDGE